MNKYKVIIEEVLRKAVHDVEADSLQEARRIVQEDYLDGKIELSHDDLYDYNFDVFTHYESKDI